MSDQDSMAEWLFLIEVARRKRAVARERMDLVRVAELNNEIGRLTADIRRAQMQAPPEGAQG